MSKIALMFWETQRGWGGEFVGSLEKSQKEWVLCSPGQDAADEPLKGPRVISSKSPSNSEKDLMISFEQTDRLGLGDQIEWTKERLQGVDTRGSCSPPKSTTTACQFMKFHN